MKLAVASDHAGLSLKREVVDLLKGRGIEVEDLGPQSDQSVDYPDFAAKVARRVSAGEAQFGILVCGTGIGVCIRANRYAHIRAAECTSIEMAQLARQHNHANVLCLGGRILSKEEGVAILRAFLETPEDQAERHARRVAMLDNDVTC